MRSAPPAALSNEVRDTTRQWAYISRSKETLDRDKNRPCVVLWGCGNENGYGANAQASFDYMKAHDPTRPALISQQGLGPNPKTDFEDYHYPSIASLKTMATSPNRTRVPVIVTEYRGARDPSGQDLIANWDVIGPADTIAGAFIWEWQDQGQLDRFPDRWSFHSPNAPPADATPGAAPPISGTPTANMTTGMRPAGGGGTVDADRQIKLLPFLNRKTVYSPVTTTATTVALADGKCVVPLQNRYSFTDLSELTCHWRALAGEKVLATGESRGWMTNCGWYSPMPRPRRTASSTRGASSAATVPSSKSTAGPPPATKASRPSAPTTPSSPKSSAWRNSWAGGHEYRGSRPFGGIRNESPTLSSDYGRMSPQRFSQHSCPILLNRFLDRSGSRAAENLVNFFDHFSGFFDRRLNGLLVFSFEVT